MDRGFGIVIVELVGGDDLAGHESLGIFIADDGTLYLAGLDERFDEGLAVPSQGFARRGDEILRSPDA